MITTRFIVGTIVGSRPLSFHPVVDFVSVKTPLGRDLGCRNISILRHAVQFTGAEFQVTRPPKLGEFINNGENTI